ncbi:hypothetical protein JR316_0005479 [Psilocybe cubensis]|uniref:Uncharacterized protein n=2 Tax=Psilocybe cubensis TaxID=181762 RepID=A0A8H7XN29_PSICU|nr:hypothetical protein JR316_0005479 [Psilocybe cubensis]KAH9483373.1 hypothetical protein JR316_0005479 [Psilocybe cubensis]
MAARQTPKKHFASASKLKSEVILDFREYQAPDVSQIAALMNVNKTQLNETFACAPVAVGTPKLSNTDSPFAFIKSNNSNSNGSTLGVKVLDGYDTSISNVGILNVYNASDLFYGMRSLCFRLNLPGLDMPAFCVDTCDKATKNPIPPRAVLADICHSVIAYIDSIKKAQEEGLLPSLVQYENTPFYTDETLTERYFWDFRTIDLSNLYLLGALKEAKSRSYVLVLGIRHPRLNVDGPGVRVRYDVV